MKLQKILHRLQKLHPKEIDLSLDRIKKLCKKLGNPQKNLKSISVVGTNGKNSTIQTMRAILNAAKIKSNILFVGQGKTFQIWEPASYEKFRVTAKKKSNIYRASLKWERQFNN